MITQEDLPILLEMKALYESAPNVKSRYVENEGYLIQWDVIWDEFWQLKDSLSFSIRWCDNDTSSEKDIKAYWKALCQYTYEHGSKLCANPKTRELGIELKKIRLTK